MKVPRWDTHMDTAPGQKHKDGEHPPLRACACMDLGIHSLQKSGIPSRQSSNHATRPTSPNFAGQIFCVINICDW